MRSPLVLERHQSLGEEMANAISHGIGALIAFAGGLFLVIAAVQEGNLNKIIGASIFAVAMSFVYLASTIYHALPRSRTKYVFQVLDHIGIFLLIAGTYTPFTLGVLRGPLGWALLIVIWTLALVGIYLKVIFGIRDYNQSTYYYMAMSWLIVIAAYPLWEKMSEPGLLLLGGGGLFYMLGVFFFNADHYMRYNHFIWHLFVLIGTACHYFAILWHT